MTLILVERKTELFQYQGYQKYDEVTLQVIVEMVKLNCPTVICLYYIFLKYYSSYDECVLEYRFVFNLDKPNTKEKKIIREWFFCRFIILIIIH